MRFGPMAEGEVSDEGYFHYCLQAVYTRTSNCAIRGLVSGLPDRMAAAFKKETQRN
jgi:hypothetical protein